MSTRPEIENDIESLIQRYVDEDLDEGGLARLQEVLKHDAEARRRYREVTEQVSILRSIAEKEKVRSKPLSGVPSEKKSFTVFLPLLGVGLIVLLGLFSFHLFSGPSVGARVLEAEDASWLSTAFEVGDALKVGTQLQLASGTVEVGFESGATSRIHGPALFEIESRNSAFLHYGKALSLADEESSKGFTIRTASSTYVDQGTEFITEAGADGYSQLFVVQGAVDAKSEGFESRRLFSGSGVGFERGEVPVMIQIEQGLETPEFEFPTIPPPSSEDFASTHPISIEIDSIGRSDKKSVLSPESAGTEVLINGRAQQNHDDPSESFFFRNETTGYLLFDLGETKSINRIHTYSWHRNRSNPELTLRAVQRFTLWGARGEKPTGFPDSENPKGWKRIARADTDMFFQVDREGDRPPQQACRILPAEGDIGEFRYLLFEVLPTSDSEGFFSRHTFFSEIDIFVK